MIAVAKIGGHQALIKKGDKIQVDKLDVEVGKKVNFDVLLVSEEDGTGFKVGKPFIDGMNVEAKVLSHGKGEKIRVFKMQPRKRYRRTQGHRQDFTEIEITDIKTGSAKKAAPKKEEKAPAKKAAPKAKSAEKKVAKSAKEK